MNIWRLRGDRDIGYRPFLFYIIFGVSGEELEVSSKKHKVDELPEGLDIITFTREDQGEWIDGWFTGTYGSVLEESNSSLFEECRKAEVCVVLQGSIEKDSTLDYMRNVIGISNVSEEKLHDYEQIINQMIYYGGQGVFFEQDTRLHTPDGKAFVIHPVFVNDFENEDYNNAYYNVTVIKEELE